MYLVTRITEADYGCEERLPGEPLMALVTIEDEYGSILQFEISDEWLTMQGIEEGDEWPEELFKNEQECAHIQDQSQWMNGYMEAMEELE